ncbi:hypothetical protein [Mycobacterium sp. 1245805.9]|uniref:hypothetical protein n=1 Tax=Mycobacterium sp. 1245805.9 TaxID=1856862 RepID=UPI00351661EA
MGQGLRSRKTIQTPNRAACSQTKFIEPANAVIRSASRSCRFSLRLRASARTAGWCTWPLRSSRRGISCGVWRWASASVVI